jgi:hypothetical protein
MTPTMSKLDAFFGQAPQELYPLDLQRGEPLQGTVMWDVTESDVFPLRMFRPKDTHWECVWRGGADVLALAVPLHTDTYQGHGLWVAEPKDSARLLAAIVKAGVKPADGRYLPRKGDRLTITYTHDVPGRAGTNPTKILEISYDPA